MRGLMACVLGIVVAACGGGGSGTAAQPSTGQGSAATAQAPTRGRSDLITEAEVGAVAYQNALEVVQNLRPAMLIPRGVGGDQTSANRFTSVPIVVYMDDIRLGEVASMVNIPATRVKEIRFVNARDATTRYGTGHSSGVILVITKR